MNDTPLYADLTLLYLGRLKEFDPSQPRDDKGQWATSGGGSAGGTSGGGSDGGSAAPKKAIGFSSPREEFRFLDRRLAAGNLKRGERKRIQRRQEELAKQALGVSS